MKIGLLGGTFDPVHMGHLILAQECWHRLELDKVIFIPAALQPLKNSDEVTSPHDRLNMLRFAVEQDDRFEISTYELDKGGISFTVDTVRHFREKFDCTVELFFLTGADSLSTLSEWMEPGEIFKVVKFVVADRPGWRNDNKYGDDILQIDIPSLDVSSTMIRDRIRSREPIDYLVPEKVVKYIRNKGLYA